MKTRRRTLKGRTKRKYRGGFTNQSSCRELNFADFQIGKKYKFCGNPVVDGETIEFEQDLGRLYQKKLTITTSKHHLENINNQPQTKTTYSYMLLFEVGSDLQPHIYEKGNRYSEIRE